MLLIILCTACNDPYEGDTFSVYDIQPAATYLSSRYGEFSEWISIMKYADRHDGHERLRQLPHQRRGQDPGQRRQQQHGRPV